MTRAELVYESMMGELVNPCPEIENAFAPGGMRDQLYSEIYSANQNLCARLGVSEDADVERIINCFFEMNRELCYRMYGCGLRDGQRGNKKEEAQASSFSLTDSQVLLPPFSAGS